MLEADGHGLIVPEVAVDIYIQHRKIPSCFQAHMNLGFRSPSPAPLVAVRHAVPGCNQRLGMWEEL